MNTFERGNSGAKQATQSHDSAAPPNLISFMLKGWKATQACGVLCEPA
jgi:hypothetical protein